MPMWKIAQGTIGQRTVDKAAIILDSFGWSAPPGPKQVLFLILSGKYAAPSPSDMPHLLELCRRELSVDIQLKVAQAFEKLQDPRAVEGLALLLEQSNKSSWDPQDICNAAWETAVRAFRQVSDTAAVGPLIRVLTKPESDFRAEAAEALGEIGDARAVEPLLQQLRDDRVDYRLRSAVGSALNKIKDPRAVEPLIKALNDTNKTVRGFAIAALQTIGDTRAVEPLLRLLADPVPGLQESAAKALGEIGDAKAVHPLKNLVLRRHEHPMVGGYDTLMIPVAAIESLGKIGNDAAVDAVGEALLHEYPRIADAASKVLARLKSARAIRPLIIWAKHGQRHGGPPLYADQAIKQLCQLLELKAIESSTEDLNLILKIGEVRQADWGGTGDDYGYSSRDFHVVDTSHLNKLAQQELHRRAALQ